MEKQWEKKSLIANDVTYCVRKIRCGKFEIISGRYQYKIPSLSNCDSFFRIFVVGRLIRLWVGRSRDRGLIPGMEGDIIFLFCKAFRPILGFAHYSTQWLPENVSLLIKLTFWRRIFFSNFSTPCI